MSQTYPFDPRAELDGNLIDAEAHLIRPATYWRQQFIVPTYTPFFWQDLRVIYHPSEARQEAVKKLVIRGCVDYVLGLHFSAASYSTTHGIYGAIHFYALDLEGTIELRYHTLGGDWLISSDRREEIAGEIFTWTPTTTWEQLIELPYQFPNVEHQHQVFDLVGHGELVESLNKLADEVSNQPAAYASLENDIKLILADQYGVPNDAQIVVQEDFNTQITSLQNSKLAASQLLYAGDGLTGGGVLGETVTVSLASPQTVTIHTGNSTSADGHSHALTLTAADINLGNVDNTADINKPISNPQQQALNAKLNADQVGEPNGVVPLNNEGEIANEYIGSFAYPTSLLWMISLPVMRSQR
jgi:hypothetical protein